MYEILYYRRRKHRYYETVGQIHHECVTVVGLSTSHFTRNRYLVVLQYESEHTMA